jgi:acetyltransferase-like isoleucine patch superfamily enzyme
MGIKAFSFIQRATAHIQTRIVRNSFESFGRSSVLFPPVRLAGVEHISVGSGVFVGSGCWLQGGVLQNVGESPTATLKIGDRVSISGNATISAVQSVVIEDGVLIASGVYICDHTHQINGHIPVRDQGITGIAPVRIGRGAWIGQNAVIMPGVSVGPGAVIGANSVVRTDVPARSVAVGAPARIIRHLDEQVASANE